MIDSLQDGLTKEVYLEVLPVQLEEQSLLISNWYFPEEFKHMNNGKEVIEGNHIAKRSTNRWTDPFWVLTPIQDKDGKFNFVKLSLDNQHVGDEPIKENIDSWEAIARYS